MALPINRFSKAVENLTTTNVDFAQEEVKNKVNRINHNIERYKNDIVQTERKINNNYSEILKLFTEKETAEWRMGLVITVVNGAALGVGFLISNDPTLLAIAVGGVGVVSCVALKKCPCPDEELLQEYTQDHFDEMIQSAQLPLLPPERELLQEDTRDNLETMIQSAQSPLLLPIPPFWMNSNENTNQGLRGRTERIDQLILMCEETEQQVYKVKEAAQKMLGELKAYRQGLSKLVQSTSWF